MKTDFLRYIWDSGDIQDKMTIKTTEPVDYHWQNSSGHHSKTVTEPVEVEILIEEVFSQKEIEFINSQKFLNIWDKALELEDFEFLVSEFEKEME